MFLILEIQVNHNDVVSTLPVVQKETIEQAQSAFYMVCASASVSTLKTHSVMLFNTEGQLLDRKYWHHDEPPASEE